jgi:hypothetical protein
VVAIAPVNRVLGAINRAYGFFNMRRVVRNLPTTEHPVSLTLYTRCPIKWILVDTETGQTYRGNPNGYWDRLEPVQRQEDE